MDYIKKTTGSFLAICVLLCLSHISLLAAYAVVGSTWSYSNGNTDFLVYKLAADGSVLWQKNFGGTGFEFGNSIRATSDNGMIIAGRTQTAAYTHGSYDGLVYKLDAAGKKLWRKVYGGQKYDMIATAIPTADGGYLLCGDGDSYTNGGYDFLVYKVDAAGGKQWRKNYGGWSQERMQGIFEPMGTTADRTLDGGYVFGGNTESYTHGGWDFLIYKVDASGAKLWRRNLGGSDEDYCNAVQRTADGGYIVVGDTRSYIHGSAGKEDMLVYKLDSAGVKLWRKNYGGDDQERAFSVCRTSDGGYVIAGYSRSFGPNYDFLLYKVDAAGQKQWRKIFGGDGYERGPHVIQTSDGGYIICGLTDSYTHGADDFLVYKLDAAGQKQWRKNYGGILSDWALCICEVN